MSSGNKALDKKVDELKNSHITGQKLNFLFEPEIDNWLQKNQLCLRKFQALSHYQQLFLPWVNNHHQIFIGPYDIFADLIVIKALRSAMSGDITQSLDSLINLAQIGELYNQNPNLTASLLADGFKQYAYIPKQLNNASHVGRNLCRQCRYDGINPNLHNPDILHLELSWV
ncbi:MAG: hypothetical protein GY787_05310 [Alteromonadales bacterium]|nr:hypothetical protein [Alteromonadales bacterium]